MYGWEVSKWFLLDIILMVVLGICWNFLFSWVGCGVGFFFFGKGFDFIILFGCVVYMCFGRC